MNSRIAKKKIKQLVGHASANGTPIYNFVSAPQYTGGSSIEKDEDYHRVEVVYLRKRFGSPLLITRRRERLLKRLKTSYFSKNYGNL